MNRTVMASGGRIYVMQECVHGYSFIAAATREQCVLFYGNGNCECPAPHTGTAG